MLDEVKEKYEITDCHVDVELNEKVIEKWTNLVTTTLQDIMLREKDYEETKSLECFWDSEEDIKRESYYFANLCSYSATKHLPYKAWLEKFEAAQRGDDLFAGVGSDNNVTSSGNVINNKSDELDLSWLDNI